VSRVDSSGDGGLGFALHLLKDRGSSSALGLGLEQTWLSRSDSPELGVRQLDLQALARFGRPFAFELGAGLAFYHGRVDIPEMEGCFGCGKYSDTTLAPLVRGGVVWSQPIGHQLVLEVGVRLIVTHVLLTKTDVHNFNPQPLTFQGGLGVSRRM